MITLSDIMAARERIAGRVHRTPMLSATRIGERAGVKLWLKCELLQKTGSFKVRGALNAIGQLTDAERARGVVGVSAGNHAQALAWAFQDANQAFATDYPATVGQHMTNTDSSPFMDIVPAISLRENERGAQIGGGWDPNWHQPTARSPS